MNELMETTIRETVGEMAELLQREEVFSPKAGRMLPNRGEVIHVLKILRNLLFPGYFDQSDHQTMISEYDLGSQLNLMTGKLSKELSAALTYQADGVAKEAQLEKRVEGIMQLFLKELPRIQQLLLGDMEAAHEGDPAAKSMEEIIFSYPGLFAIFVYRIAHILYMENVPFIPRIMTEYAHSKTGIDIHAGATIGTNFFIDHGTGVVIGETTVIGDYVKVYQGVTLGAMSTRAGQKLAGRKRHPTVGNHVTLYSNATVLGGKTVIGDGVTIGGNAFITESVIRESYQTE